MKKKTTSNRNGSSAATSRRNGKSSSNGKSSNGKATNGRAGQAKKTGSNGMEDNESALYKFFLDGLKDIYWAEKHLVKTLPKMSKAASTSELQEAFDGHLEETRGHVEKLEEVFAMLEEKAQGKKCDGMEGLTKEGTESIEDTEDGSLTRDAALIIAAQKVEHYEIAAYGSLCQLATTLGKNDVSEKLGEILDEEKDTDEKLTHLAESFINQEALHEEEA